MLRARRPVVLAALVPALMLAVGTASAADPPDAGLRITYPAEGTLFPPDSVAPTVVWTDDSGAGRWTVAVHDDAGAEVLTASADASRWRPSEDDWKRIKERSAERDVEIAVSTPRSSAHVRVRTSKDPVGDSLFYRE